jgi:hypothetical protein
MFFDFFCFFAIFSCVLLKSCYLVACLGCIKVLFFCSRPRSHTDDSSFFFFLNFLIFLAFYDFALFLGFSCFLIFLGFFDYYFISFFSFSLVGY